MTYPSYSTHLERIINEMGSGNVQKVVGYLSAAQGVDRRTAKNMVNAKLREMQYEGRVRLFYKEQSCASPIFEVVG